MSEVESMTEGEVAEHVSGLLWAFTEANGYDQYGWVNTWGLDIGEVTIFAKNGVKYVLTVERGTYEEDELPL